MPPSVDFSVLLFFSVRLLKVSMFAIQSESAVTRRQGPGAEAVGAHREIAAET